MEQGMTVAGRCRLLWSSAGEVSSYMCFPSGFLNKFQTEALKSISSRMSQQTSASSTDSRIGLAAACRQRRQKEVCQRGVTPEHNGH